MESGGCRFCLCAILFFLAFPTSSLTTTTGYDPPISFGKKLLALHDAINYMRERPRQMNFDAILGLFMAKAHLRRALEHRNTLRMHDTFRDFLTTVYLLSDVACKTLKGVFFTESEDIRIISRGLLVTELWGGPIEWTNLSVDGEIARSHRNLTYDDAAKLVTEGCPKERDSDRCILALVRGRSAKVRAGRIPEVCARILRERRVARGYPLNHRLLVLQIAMRLGYEELPNFPYTPRKTEYCRQIWRDLLDVESLNFPYNTQDLAMEEILLCGMEGFLEFTEKRYEDDILSWPHESGCFSGFGFSREKRRRRASLLTDFGCDSHATGVAVATLALLVRKDVELPVPRTV